ncbi:hypothetical protein D3C85_1233170 [compost metagenome]
MRISPVCRRPICFGIKRIKTIPIKSSSVKIRDRIAFFIVIGPIKTVCITPVTTKVHSYFQIFANPGLHFASEIIAVVARIFERRVCFIYPSRKEIGHIFATSGNTKIILLSSRILPYVIYQIVRLVFIIIKRIRPIRQAFDKVTGQLHGVYVLIIFKYQLICGSISLNGFGCAVCGEIAFKSKYRFLVVLTHSGSDQQYPIRCSGPINRSSRRIFQQGHSRHFIWIQHIKICS